MRVGAHYGHATWSRYVTPADDRENLPERAAASEPAKECSKGQVPGGR